MTVLHYDHSTTAVSLLQDRKDIIMTSRVRVFVLFTAAYFMSYFYRSTNAVIALPDLVADVEL